MKPSLTTKENYDVYCFSRLLSEVFFPYFLHLKEKGKTIVWDVDDDLFNVPTWNPVYHEVERGKARFKRALYLCDYISVTTPELKQSLPFPDKAFVCPNYIDLSSFAPEQDHEAGVTRILWAGSDTHVEDLTLLVDAVIRIKDKWQDKVEFTFLGQMPPVLSQVATFIQGVELQYYVQKLTELKPHIGLAPLARHPFNRSKSNIKYLEYTASNAVTIASLSPPYYGIQHDVDGMLVGAGLGNWYDCMDYLIGDVSKRNDMLLRARVKVQELYSWHNEEARNVWLEFFRMVAT